MKTKFQSTNQSHNCCGGPAPENTDACCVKDADAKAAGQMGCGCNDTTNPATKQNQTSCC